MSQVEGASSADIKDLQAAIASQTEALKSLHGRNHDMKNMDALDKEQFEKIADASLKSLEKSNALEAELIQAKEKAEQFEKRCESLEKEFYRGNKSLESASHKGFCYSDEEFKSLNRFLRASTPEGRMRELSNLREVNFRHVKEMVKEYHPHLPEDELNRVTKTYVEGSDVDGGFFVRPEYANFFIKRDLNSASVRPWVNVVPMRSAKMEIIIDDDISKRAKWEGELCNGFNPDDNNEIGQATLVAKMLRDRISASDEILQDSFMDLEAYIFDKANMRMMLAENDAVINGNGANEIKGILQYADWTAPGQYTRDAIERIETAGAGVIAYDDIVDLQAALPAIYRPNARWFMSRFAWAEILKIKGTDDQPLLKPMDGFREGFQQTMLGYPVTVLDQMPGVASTQEPIILGDYKRALTLGDRLTTEILRNPYVNQCKVEFWIRRRLGFLVTAYDGIKILRVQ